MTVRVSVSRPAIGNEITLHFVNYNRQEPSDKHASGHGIKDEKPISAPSCDVDFVLPPAPTPPGLRPSSTAAMLDRKERIRRVEFLTPEQDQPSELKFEQTAGRLHFRIPGFLVYGVARIEFSGK